MDVKLSGIVELLAIPLIFLKDSKLYTIPCGSYRSLNEQNQMCELCTFSQIRSHLQIYRDFRLMEIFQDLN